MKARVLAMLAFVAAAAGLAACGGGGGTTPSTNPTTSPTSSPTSSPTNSPTNTPTNSPTSSPTSSAAFSGGKQTISATSSGGSFSLTPADATYSGTVTFGANDATSAFNFTMSWATFSQITGTFAPGALPSSTIGTALIYFDFNAATTVNFTQTPGVTISTTGSFPGTKCGFAVYGTPGSGTGQAASWFSMTAVGLSEVSPSGSSFTIPAASLGAGNTVKFNGGQDQYIAVYCH